MKKKTDADDAEDAEAQEETEEDKKKFKPENFDWFEIRDSPRTFPQFFTDMHATEVVQAEYSDTNSSGLKQEFYRLHRDMEEGQDVYRYIELVAPSN